MFEWMTRHKKDIMKYTLWLIIPSFILLYGYGTCAKPQKALWVANVNGEQIIESAITQWIETINKQMSQYQKSAAMPYEEVRNQAIQMAVVSVLYQQKAKEWGISTTNDELLEAIKSMKVFQDESGRFDVARYRYLLNANHIDPLQFEQEQRTNLDRNKIQSVVRNSITRSKSEKDRFTARQNQKASIEFLSFEPSAFTEEVQPVTDEMKAFFEKNKEDYRVPEKRQIGYVFFAPSAYVKEVSPTEREVERFFDANSKNYEVPEKVRVQYLQYSADAFVSQVSAPEDQIKKYYEENAKLFVFPEQYKFRFAKKALAGLASVQDVSDQEIKDFYDKNIVRYTHEEQAKARHILLQVTSGATIEQASQTAQKIVDIRKEIVGGLAFAEAAKKYSQDPGSANNGGDLGFFGRKEMVPEFDKAAFELPLNQISEPIKTQYGYHLIIVDERREKGTDPLEKVKSEIKDTLQKGKTLKLLQDKAASLTSLDQLGSEYSIQSVTDWIGRNQDIPGVDVKDKYLVFTAATREDQKQKVHMAGNARSENVYFVELLEKKDRQPKTFEQAYQEAKTGLSEKLAVEIAKEAAKTDSARIKTASFTLEQIAEEHRMQIRTSDLFSREDQYIPGFGRQSAAVISAAFSLKQGGSEGPIDGDQGSSIIRLMAKEAAHIPEFVTVKDKVRENFIQNRAERLARNAAGSFSDELINENKKVEKGAKDANLEYKVSEFFAQNDSIPNLGFKRNIASEAFETLKRKNDISNAIEEKVSSPRQRNPEEGPVEGYYVIQLLDIKKTYLPTFEEAVKEAEKDFRVALAEKVIEDKAAKTLEAIKAKITAGPAPDATRSVDLKAFAAGENQKGPSYNEAVEITGMGSVPKVGFAPSFAKTAFELKKGQVSGLVKNFTKKRDKEGNVTSAKMTGIYIIQVLDHIQAAKEEKTAPNQYDQMYDYQLSSNVFAAWIDEVSAAAKIHYNPAYIKDNSDSIAEPSGEVKDSTAAAGAK